MSTDILTDHQVTLLDAIVRSQFQHGKAAEDVVDTPVWTWDVTHLFSSNAQAGGVISRAVKADLIESHPGNDDEATLSITRKGWDALARHGIADPRR